MLFLFSLSQTCVICLHDNKDYCLILRQIWKNRYNFTMNATRYITFGRLFLIFEKQNGRSALFICNIYWTTTESIWYSMADLNSKHIRQNNYNLYIKWCDKKNWCNGNSVYFNVQWYIFCKIIDCHTHIIHIKIFQLSICN